MTTIGIQSRLDLQQLLCEADQRKKTAQLQYLAQHLRIIVFDILHEKQTGHWGGASSVAELLTSLYFHVMNIQPEQPDWPDRDRLVLSKGHASCMLYAVLAYRGFFRVEELATFRQIDSRLQGHPCMRSTPGVDMSTGALGHGMSVALGMALGARFLGKSFWSYALLGEGDLDEGQTWEAIMSAAKFRPERLVALVDYNKVQLDGPSQEIMPLDPLPQKFLAFNWNVAPRCYDGNDMAQVLASFDWVRRQGEWPVVVIYTTRKGRGISFTENQAYWHGAPIDQDSYTRGRAELIERLAELEAEI